MNQTPLNILWFTTDQQRYDTIRALGNPFINTPTFDHLVKRGFAFDRAYVQSPICTPSRVSMMTGRYPASHHVHQNGTDHFPTEERVVTSILAEEGYHCALIGKHHLSRAEHRDEVRPEDGYSTVHAAHDPFPEPRAYGEWLRAKHGVDAISLHRETIQRSPQDYGVGVPSAFHPVSWWSETAIEFIENVPAEPWLLNLNPIDPHPPWFPPEEYLSRYEPAEMPGPAFRKSDLEHEKRFADVDQQWEGAFDPEEFDPATLPDLSRVPLDKRNPWDIPPAKYDPRRIKACYYATIELVDAGFGRVLAALEETGQADRTVIIATSDHGDMLGDHGLLYKGCRFFDGLVRVPLIISGPVVRKPGTRSSALVEAIDIAPTILGIVGIPRHPRMQGQTLLPVIGSDVGIDRHKRIVVSHYNNALPLEDGTHASMVLDDTYKSVIYHNHEGLGEIYDMSEDPKEFVDLWNTQRDLRGALVERHLNAVLGTSDSGIPRSATY